MANDPIHQFQIHEYFPLGQFGGMEFHFTNSAVSMIATVRSEGQFNTIIYEERDTYRNKAPRDAVFLNRDDMAARGIVDGQRLTLASDTGRMSVVATEFDLPRGSAMAYYPEANVLCGTAVDPRSHTPAFKSVPVWLEV